MRIKMKTTLAGPDRVAASGSVIDVSADEAKALCDGGYAEALEVLPGHAVSVSSGEGAPEVRPQPLSARDVAIPDDWRHMSAKDMKALADQLVETPVKTRNEALSVIEAECASRAAAGASELPLDGA